MRALRVPLLAVALAALVTATFWGAQFNDFASDDSVYLIGNAALRQGLSAAGVRWAFTSLAQANWHPLTWLSHLLDEELFGLAPRGPHLVNVSLHALNAVLLFALVRSLTGALWRAWLVAAIFALHPLRAESVAWISERKDLLSGTCFLLALLAHVRHARRPGWRWQLAVALLFALGLLAKPMVVTLPFVLLLLDRWPLGRLGRGTWVRSVLEKLPLLALVPAAAAVTIVAQARGGALLSLQALPLATRAANAVVSYATYLGQLVWPLRLAVCYPYPAEPLRQAALAAAPLAALTAGAVLAARRRPALLTGWLWYLGMLVPVIGVVQVGTQPHADRYTYLPQIGVVLAAAFAARLPAALSPRLRVAAALGCALPIVALAALTRAQVATWKNDLTLYRHAAAAVPGNAEAWNYVGFLLVWSDGDRAEAARCFAEAIRIDPGSFEPRFNLGLALTRWGRPGEAVGPLSAAVDRNPGSARVRVALGRALELAGRGREALAQYEEALRLEPGRASLRPAIERLRAARAPGRSR